MKRGEPIIRQRWIFWGALILGAALGYMDTCRHGRPATFRQQIIESERLRHQ